MSQVKRQGPAWNALPNDPVESTFLYVGILIAIMVAFVSLSLYNSRWAREIVKFRLSTEKTVHLKDEVTAKSYAQSLTNLGCENRLTSHAGHLDVTMSCPEWRDAEFTEHSIAQEWQAWLGALGFETRRQH